MTNQLNQDELASASRSLDGQSPQHILEWSVKTFHPRLTMATSIGAEGLPVASGRNIVLADEPEGFARQVVKLLNNRSRREELGRAARQLVERNYSWKSVGADLTEILSFVAHGLPIPEKPSGEHPEPVHRNS